MTVTLQTLFLRRAEDVEPSRRALSDFYGDRMPATNYVLQPPCEGQALALEAWAVGGNGVRVEHPHQDVVTVDYDGLHWIYLGGIAASEGPATAYEQARTGFRELARRLDQAGATMGDVVRVWLHQGGITEVEESTERYRELNRARTDFFDDEVTRGTMTVHRGNADHYPASTGIGTLCRGFSVSGMALKTTRTDVRLRPLENPQQTSSFQYAPSFSAKSPKFSRAMAVQIGDYVTTWVSGTASIIRSESVFVGDAAAQTRQSLDNIERLIAPDNFARHGMEGVESSLHDLAKIRVYVKRPEDYEACRAVCERRLGPVPAVYALADVCRPELLVEVEGVAFSRVRPSSGGNSVEGRT
ncbi:MAG: dioxygenase [Pirellulales bacterium]